MASEAEKIDRIWSVLHEQGCLPYSANVRDIVPEERLATPEEVEQIKAADRKAEQQNREFCRRLLEAAQDYPVTHVEGS